MKAVLLNQETNKLEYREVEKPSISKSEVLIKMVSASINHHELWSLKEGGLKSDSEIIMGSDGAGIIEEIGSNRSAFKKGEEVIINPSISWGNNSRVQGPEYEILGFPTQGTFAQYISINNKYVYHKPKHLTFNEAASIPLAGLTAYRALFTRGEFEPTNKVLITGIGGGAALFVLNFAIACGAEVYVSSGNESKITKALALGAKAGVNYKDSNWDSELKNKAGGFDVIVDSAAGKDFSKLTELANPGGRISLFGRTAGVITNLKPSILFWKQLSIHGTTMGSDKEFGEMIKFIDDKKIHPVIDSVFSLKDIHLAFDKMDKGEQFGKIVIDMNE